MWQHIIESCLREKLIDAVHREPLEIILRQGPLSRRLIKAIGEDYSKASLHAVYGQLGDCLQQNRMFVND